PFLGLYNAAKWGLEGFSEALAAEVQSMGIRVTLAEIGAMDTQWATSGMRFSEPNSDYDELREQLLGTATVPWPSEPGATGGGTWSLAACLGRRRRRSDHDGARAPETGLLHSTWIPALPELSPPSVHYRRPRRPGPVPACTALTRSALDGLRPLTFLCSHNRRHDDTRQRGTDPAPPLEGRAPRRRRRVADQRGVRAAFACVVIGPAPTGSATGQREQRRRVQRTEETPA